MQGGIFRIRTIKCIAWCRRHLFCIAIDITKYGAFIESITPYARHTIADSNRGQTRAIFESTLPYARHTIGDSNRGQTIAIIESLHPYARHTICSTLMLHRLRDNNFTRILATALRYNSSLLCLGNKVIVYPINLNLFCQHGQGQEHCQGQEQCPQGIV